VPRAIFTIAAGVAEADARVRHRSLTVPAARAQHRLTSCRLLATVHVMTTPSLHTPNNFYDYAIH
jgi:hypothetical protein